MPSIAPLTKKRVTQSDVARVAGVHNTTVSLALRNCASIPESTRQRIRAIADEMGYSPDPALQALIAYRTGRIPNRPRETLAYITNWDTRWGWRAYPMHERAFVGAQRKASELGYQLEHFWLGEPGMRQGRLSDILFHRGITGVLLAGHPTEGDSLTTFDWSRFSIVQIGGAPRTPMLHRVDDDRGSMTRRALQRCLAAGFTRVGLVLAEWADDAVDQVWSTSLFTEQSRLAVDDRLPVLRFSGSRQDWIAECSSGAFTRQLAGLAKWRHVHRPEVIIGFSPVVRLLIERLGWAVPNDVAYVDLCLERTDHSIAGTRLNSDAVGDVATTMLIAQLRQNIRGIPSVPTTTMVDGTWVDGASLPATRGPRCDLQPRALADEIEGVWLATA